MSNGKPPGNGLIEMLRDELEQLKKNQSDLLAQNQSLALGLQASLEINNFSTNLALNPSLDTTTEGAFDLLKPCKTLFAIPELAAFLNTLLPEATVQTRQGDGVDAYLFWGASLQNLQSLIDGTRFHKPVFYIESAFLNSAVTWLAQRQFPQKYWTNRCFVLDDLTHYFDGSRASRLELKLESDEALSAGLIERAAKGIELLVQHRLTKYNHQPMQAPALTDIQSRTNKKVLIIEQAMNDFSIIRSGCGIQTFRKMLECALEENPDSDVIIKTHPDMQFRKGGYYTDLQSNPRVVLFDEPINPYALLEHVDKIYTVSSQLGFEALMAGKEVVVFGTPFYAGWGLTDDRRDFPRRTRKRSLPEIFHYAYIWYTRYFSPEKQAILSLEEAIEDMIYLREEFARHSHNGSLPAQN